MKLEIEHTDWAVSPGFSGKEALGDYSVNT